MAFLKKKGIARTFLTSFIIVLLFSLQTSQIISSETNSTNLATEPNIVSEIGTHFEATYEDFNFTLDSSSQIYLYLEASPETIAMEMKAESEEYTPRITISGLLPQTTYYMYQDGYENHSSFNTDEYGKYTFTIDLTQPEIILIQKNESTIGINETNGGDCNSIGVWDNNTKTCTLTQDVYDSISLYGVGLTLDGNGHSVIDPGGNSRGIDTRRNQTVKNINVDGFFFGIWVGTGTQIINSSARNNRSGIVVWRASRTLIKENYVTNNAYGIRILHTHSSWPNNVVTKNTTYHNGYWEIEIFEADNNVVYNNNIIRDPSLAPPYYRKGVIVWYQTIGNVFNLAAPIGGNYWSLFDSPEEGCEDLNTDGFCDSPFYFSGGVDNLPLTTQDGWNQPPTASPGGPYQVNEGDSIYLDGTNSSDPDENDTLTYEWDFDYDGVNFDTDATSETPLFDASNLDGPSTVTVALKVTDNEGAEDIGTTTVNVNNVAPTITNLTLPNEPVSVDEQPISATVEFTDPGVLDTHTVTWNWGDGASDEEVMANSPLDITHAYTEPGVYIVEVRVVDDDGGEDTAVYEYVVVYQPDGGFVTGGGWIWSEKGWCQMSDLCFDAEGKANFGFVSKYKKGASEPSGNTEFNFTAGSLNFHSNEYDWLVINQADQNAQYKGSGMINGNASPNNEPYKFILWASDRSPLSDDTFRIKIWYEDNGTETVVYDNGFNQPLGNGNIKIHN